MLRWFPQILIALSICFASPAGAEERPVMAFIYHSDDGAPSPNQTRSQRDLYTMEVLNQALERTREAYGDYTLTPSPAMHEKYGPNALEHGDEGINVSVFPAKNGLADKLIPVRIPIHRGLIGYRVLTILAADQPRFERVREASDLKAFRFGLLGQWDDVKILQGDGIPVETATSQDGLFHMLDAKRCDALSNAVPPVMLLFGRYGAAYPKMAIEKRLLLHYPMPFYFWFRNSEDGRRRAERLQAGLLSMVRDGTLKTLFYKHYGDVLKQLDFDHRRVIELPNPTLDGQDPLDDPALWYRPGEPH